MSSWLPDARLRARAVPRGLCTPHPVTGLTHLAAGRSGGAGGLPCSAPAGTGPWLGARGGGAGGSPWALALRCLPRAVPTVTALTWSPSSLHRDAFLGLFPSLSGSLSRGPISARLGRFPASHACPSRAWAPAGRWVPGMRPWAGLPWKVRPGSRAGWGWGALPCSGMRGGRWVWLAPTKRGRLPAAHWGLRADLSWVFAERNLVSHPPLSLGAHRTPPHNQLGLPDTHPADHRSPSAQCPLLPLPVSLAASQAGPREPSACQTHPSSFSLVF